MTEQLLLDKSVKTKQIALMSQEELNNLTLEELYDLMPLDHIRFAEEYIISLNKAQAFKISRGNPNLSHKHCVEKGSILFKENPSIQLLVKRLMEVKSEENIAKQDEVLEFLSDVMRNNHMKLGYEKNIYVKDRIQAAELLGKRYALFTDRIQGQLQLESLQIEIIDAEAPSNEN